MLFTRFLTVIAVAMNIFGVIFMLWGSFSLTPHIIARLSMVPFGGFDVDRLETLPKEKAHIYTGLTLVLLASLLQILPTMLGLEEYRILSENPNVAQFLVWALVAIIFCYAWGLKESLSVCFLDSSKRAVVSIQLQSAFAEHSVSGARREAVARNARVLLGIAQGKNETVYEFLRRLAQELRIPYPDNLRVENNQGKTDE